MSDEIREAFEKQCIGNIRKSKTGFYIDDDTQTLWNGFIRGWNYAFLRAGQPVVDLPTAIKHKRAGMGIRETAKQVGISPTTLSKVENGHIPDAKTQAKLCDWLGLRLVLSASKDQS